MKDRIITRVIKIAGFSSIIIVLMIFLFLLREGLPALSEVALSDLFTTRWYPIEDYFGILPLFSGSLLVTFISIAIAIPFGVGTAVYIAEIAPQRVKEILKPMIEILAGIPSVVLGFIGIVFLSPTLRELLNLPTGLTAFTGALLLALISIPTIVSVGEDALNAVPQSYREASYALGITRWQTIWRVTLPAARSGVLTAVMLGISRTLGETMAVMMVTGNAPTIFKGIQSLFKPARTMTATIASEMGEVASGSTHYHVLFFIGIVLFLFSLIINIISNHFSEKNRKDKEQVVS
ncbi:MAG: phosphate ABC transporter permease subunit PstC [Anaerolineaceae bacterium]|jgi:phosphate transport system permease protein|nr:MAG: phosphate ABC transporter permease subunit PstC [Anaerolineaceae bacterium]